MRRFTCLAIFLVNAAMPGWGMASDNEAQRIASAADANRVAREEEKLLIKALSQRITLDCEDTSLNEAVHQFSEIIDRDILFDAIGILDEGISMDQAITLQLGEMTAWQTLHFLLKPLQLTWVAHDGVIEVTTETNASAVFVTRVYDVRNLCKLLEPLTRDMFVRQRRGKPQPVPAGGMGGGGFFSIPVTPLLIPTIGQFGGGAGGAKPAARAMVPKSVEAILADAIRACSGLLWEDDADEAGSIQLGQGCLIIRQTYRGQFEIAGMLQVLEELAGGKVPGKSITAGRLGYPAEEDTKLFQILSKPTTLQLEEAALGQALRQVAETKGIRIWIDESGLNDDGVSLDQSIGPRRRMQKIPLAICLKKILEPLDLAWVVEEGVVVITNKTKASEMMTIRFYDISGITKIATEDRDLGVVSVLSRSTRGQWAEIHGEGGSAALVSSKHLAVRQTQQVHAEIAMLIEDLAAEELKVPSDPALELRVYAAPDADTARDLERVLPQMLETQWIARGSIRQAGASLFVNQPVSVHDRVDDIMQKLEHSHSRKAPSSANTEPEKPAVPENPPTKDR